MKIASILLLMTIGTNYAIAQEQIPTENYKKNELGLTSQWDFGNDPTFNLSMQAIQYKRWKNEHFGTRFLLGRIGLDRNMPYRTSYGISNDTVTKRAYTSNANIVFAGVGLEAQRKFYKKVVLFAAVETKFGFGKSDRYSYDSRTQYTDTPSIGIPIIDTTMRVTTTRSDVFYAGITPTVGAKLQFKRICFGSEISWNLLTYITHNELYALEPTYNRLDFGRFSPRFFVQYCF